MKLKLNLNLMAAVLLGSATALAGGRSIDQSTKPWVNGGRSKPDNKTSVSFGSTSVAMTCEKCKDTVEIRKRDVATKPWQGQKLIAVSVHQCAGCRDEMVRKQGTKDMMLVHQCTDRSSKPLSCCATTASPRG